MNIILKSILLILISWFLIRNKDFFFGISFLLFIGIASSISLSVIGATIGIVTTAKALAGAAIKTPRIKGRNMISFLLCEVVGICGFVFTMIQLQILIEINRNSNQYSDTKKIAIFWSGLTVGISNLVCGMSVGVSGSSIALADAQDSKLFSELIIIEIFASLIGLLGFIVGVMQLTAI